MPSNELETHPYLFDQVTDFADQNRLAKYDKLIIGTFPIYAITNSNPVEELGFQKRANWMNDAFMQYFYGSWKNHFWEMLGLTFDDIIPDNRFAAIDLLEKYDFLITDVFKQSSRKKYSPLDSDLINPVLNEGIRHLIQNAENLKTIYFTSKGAKVKFCEIMHIPHVSSTNNIEVILDRNYRLIVLISPAGGGRTVPHFFNDFPLTEEEIDLVNTGQRYAYAYRLRYYTHYLQLPLN